MKTIAVACIFQLVVGAVHASVCTQASIAADPNPLSQALVLMDKLAAKITEEGTAEDAAFGKYMDFCAKDLVNLELSVKAQKMDVQDLEAKLAKATSEITVCVGKIETLAGSLSSDEAQLKQATAVRKTEIADFQAGEKELVESIDMLSRAILILSAELKKNPAAAFAQVTTNSSKGMDTLVKTFSTLIDAAAFSVSERQKLIAMVQARESGSDTDDLGDMGAPAAAVYKSHSASIVDVLEDLKDKAESELSSLRKAEMNAKHSFTMLKQSLTAQMEDDSASLEEQKSLKSEAEADQASAQTSLTSTLDDLAKDEENLASSKTNCATLKEDHEASVKSRSAELAAIAKARTVLEEKCGCDMKAAQRVYGMKDATSPVCENGPMYAAFAAMSSDCKQKIMAAVQQQVATTDMQMVCGCLAQVPPETATALTCRPVPTFPHTVSDMYGQCKQAMGGAASFFQVGKSSGESQMSTRADLANAEVVNLIKKLAREQHSKRLQQLASRIAAVVRYGASAGEDPFAKVKALIADMVSKLEAEQSAEQEEKQYCDENIAETEKKKEALTSGLDKLSSKIQTAAAASADMKAKVKVLQAELAQIVQYQAQLKELRVAEQALFMGAQKDLNEGLEAVRSAISALEDYYGAKEESFVQTKVGQPEMPEFHKKAGDAGEGIIGMLEVVESDFAKALATASAEEQESQEIFEKTDKMNKESIAAKERDVKFKSKAFKTLDQEVKELKGSKEQMSEELSAVLEFSATLSQRCTLQPMSYEGRKARREAEIAGLQEALSILENEMGFLQRRKRGSARGHFLASA